MRTLVTKLRSALTWPYELHAGRHPVCTHTVYLPYPTVCVRTIYVCTTTYFTALHLFHRAQEGRVPVRWPLQLPRELVRLLPQRVQLVGVDRHGRVGGRVGGGGARGVPPAPPLFFFYLLRRAGLGPFVTE